MARQGGAVLMAVRNGARFLPEQLDSLRDPARRGAPGVAPSRHDRGRRPSGDRQPDAPAADRRRTTTAPPKPMR